MALIGTTIAVTRSMVSGTLRLLSKTSILALRIGETSDWSISTFRSRTTQILQIICTRQNQNLILFRSTTRAGTLRSCMRRTRTMSEPVRFWLTLFCAMKTSRASQTTVAVVRLVTHVWCKNASVKPGESILSCGWTSTVRVMTASRHFTLLLSTAISAWFAYSSSTVPMYLQ